MATVSFYIPGKPQGKARPKTVRNQHTGKIHTYTPAKTTEYESLVKLCAKTAENKHTFFNDEPLMITIYAYFDIPKSTTKKDREKILCGEKYPTKKPDWDNIGKIVCDALNGVLYKDDSQIVRALVLKEYTANSPYVYVKVRELAEKDSLKNFRDSA